MGREEDIREHQKQEAAAELAAAWRAGSSGRGVLSGLIVAA